MQHAGKFTATPFRRQRALSDLWALCGSEPAPLITCRNRTCLTTGMNAISETEKKYGRYCYKIAKNILHIDEDAKEGEARLSLALSAFGLRRPVLW